MQEVFVPGQVGFKVGAVSSFVEDAGDDSELPQPIKDIKTEMVQNTFSIIDFILLLMIPKDWLSKGISADGA